jgi:hypothetical protein
VPSRQRAVIAPSRHEQRVTSIVRRGGERFAVATRSTKRTQAIEERRPMLTGIFHEGLALKLAILAFIFFFVALLGVITSTLGRPQTRKH